ncbi:MAG: hypothetical protein J7K21_06430 [Desulfurococcales archaeon]|nr:hypothetical protein [Desulfurococcales archaeon]
MVFRKTKEPYWVQSVWLAIGYLLLALEEKGLASLTYTPPKVKWANKLLNVPGGIYASGNNTCRQIREQGKD